MSAEAPGPTAETVAEVFGTPVGIQTTAISTGPSGQSNSVMNSNMENFKQTLEAVQEQIFEMRNQFLMDRSPASSTHEDDPRCSSLLLATQEPEEEEEEVDMVRFYYQQWLRTSQQLVIPSDKKVSQNRSRDLGIVIGNRATLSEKQTQSVRAATAVDAAACQLARSTAQRGTAVEEISSSPLPRVEDNRTVIISSPLADQEVAAPSISSVSTTAHCERPQPLTDAHQVCAKTDAPAVVPVLMQSPTEPESVAAVAAEHIDSEAVETRNKSNSTVFKLPVAADKGTAGASTQQLSQQQTTETCRIQVEGSCSRRPLDSANGVELDCDDSRILAQQPGCWRFPFDPGGCNKTFDPGLLLCFHFAHASGEDRDGKTGTHSHDLLVCKEAMRERPEDTVNTLDDSACVQMTLERMVVKGGRTPRYSDAPVRTVPSSS